MDKVHKYIAESLLSIGPSASLLDAIRMMSENEIHSLMVEEGGEYIGILTSHDISRKAVTMNLDIEIAKVSEVMTFPLIKLDAEKSMTDAAEIMREKGVHHLLITENDQPLGILSINDYIDYLVATL
ncbi:MAG: hypothetical protein COV66_13330 [Nitrospinae bacterium CG11_big_fil_rev_8_21_14_0_20_45_15]|nr:MAG: hypothetical protein COV66_13330 [Nitrospinae bacterium CG11_big_fil_rev_8_21_14_0_20_45_15]